MASMPTNDMESEKETVRSESSSMASAISCKADKVGRKQDRSGNEKTCCARIVTVHRVSNTRSEWGNQQQRWKWPTGGGS